MNLWFTVQLYQIRFQLGNKIVLIKLFDSFRFIWMTNQPPFLPVHLATHVQHMQLCVCEYFRRVCVLDNRWMARRAANLQIFMSGPASGRQRQPMPQTTMWAEMDGLRRVWQGVEGVGGGFGCGGFLDPLAGGVETSSVVAVLALWQKCSQERTSCPPNYFSVCGSILSSCDCVCVCMCLCVRVCVCVGRELCGIEVAFDAHLNSWRSFKLVANKPNRSEANWANRWFSVGRQKGGQEGRPTEPTINDAHQIG